MDTRASSTAPKMFASPRKSLGDVDTPAVARLIAAASDLALVVDEGGKIHDAATSIPALQREDVGAWVGKNWLDVLTPESRNKAERLMKDAVANAATKWRELNHPLAAGGFATISYGAMQIGAKGRIVLLGRDLSATAALQQRLVAAQMETEREYARVRQSETRFAVLFDASSEALLIVTPGSYKIVEINAAGVGVLGRSAKRLIGRSALDLFDTAGARAIMTMLATIQGAGYSEATRARLNEPDCDVRVSAALFRHDRGEQFLVRLAPIGAEAGGILRNAPDLTAVVDAMPDAFVVADADFRVIRANAPFLDMVQVASAAQVRDQPLERWIGRPGVDLEALAAVLKQHGFVRNFQTILRGERGLDEDIEISALNIPDTEQPHISIAIRSVPRRRVSTLKGGRELPQSVEQMTELVGRVPLKEMVREATDWIERLSIEAALIVTGDNRASAADMLGFSRQSLYMKMRRYGLGDTDQDDSE